MYIIDDLKSAFYKIIVPLLNNRGIDLVLLSELGDRTNLKPSGTFISLTDTEFDCVADQNFKTFLKQHKFKRAVLLKPKCADFKIETFFNSAVTIVETPFELENDSPQNIFYIHSFLEHILQNQPNLPCSSEVSAKLVNLVRKISKTDATVLINGPTGSGKEVLSSLIHSFSNRKDNPYIALNCAAIPDQMLESILFGHEKGAFTGAVQANQGLVRAASTGTILLDEISEMPLNLQSKLLRVIQEKHVLPIGSSTEIQVDVRIIATTNRNMFNEVKLGNFREDLFYRLNVFPLNNLSLVDRIEDVIPIIAHMLFRSYVETGELLSINEEALLALMQHSWPGNVRELDNIIQRARILSSGDQIAPSDLIFDNNANGEQLNTAEILAAKFKTATTDEVV